MLQYNIFYIIGAFVFVVVIGIAINAKQNRKKIGVFSEDAIERILKNKFNSNEIEVAIYFYKKASKCFIGNEAIDPNTNILTIKKSYSFPEYFYEDLDDLFEGKISLNFATDSKTFLDVVEHYVVNQHRPI